MKLGVVISTMNKLEKDLDLKNKNLVNNYIVINQVERKLHSDMESYYSFEEVGLSKSRNRGIQKSNGDIILLTDDDVYYKENFDKLIIDEFNKNPELDILTFKVETPEGEEFKNYKKSEFNHNYKSVLNVSSIEIALKKETIEKHKLKYDEMFGLGSLYKSGEENILLYDALKKGCKIKFVPITIAIHPNETSGRNLTEETIFSKGALFYRLFGIKSVFINLLFVLKKRKEIKKHQTINKAIKSIYSGSYDYIWRKNEFR